MPDEELNPRIQPQWCVGPGDTRMSQQCGWRLLDPGLSPKAPQGQSYRRPPSVAPKAALGRRVAVA
jgi:hypothetical protein